MGEKDDNGPVEAVATEEGGAAPSRILFEFHGFSGLLKGYQMQNVSPDQLLFLAQWLDWYSKRVKDHAEMRKAQAAAQILRPGQLAPTPEDLKNFD